MLDLVSLLLLLLRLDKLTYSPSNFDQRSLLFVNPLGWLSLRRSWKSPVFNEKR
jgi:hypothetical protein